MNGAGTIAGLGNRSGLVSVWPVPQENDQRNAWQDHYENRSLEDWYETAHQKVRGVLDETPRTEDAHAINERLATVTARLQEDDRAWREGRDGWWQGYVRGLDSQY